MKHSTQLLFLALSGAILAMEESGSALPLDSTITYQGQLNDSGAPAAGSYDVRFTLYDAPTSGNVVFAPLTYEDVAISNGLVNASLNFGNAAFNGEARWLEVALRHGTNSGAFTPLLPRQTLTAAPYAVHALNANTVAWSGITGVPAGVSNGGAGGDHFGETWSGSNTNSGLEVVNAGGTALTGQEGAGSSWNFPMVAGVWGDSGNGDGVVGTSQFRGVWGRAVGNALNYGVVGYSSSSLGTGVYGKAGGANGGTGVLGETVSPYGTGVSGEATAVTGVSVGVSGTTASMIGVGVFGFATNTSGANRGVHGVSQSPQGIGVHAENTAGGVALKASGSIQSTADTVLFYPGWTLKPGRDSQWYYITAEPNADKEYPTLQIPPGGQSTGSWDWYAVVPLTLPGQLYGQPIRIKEITVYCEVIGAGAKIDRTILRAQGNDVHTDFTDRTGNGSYTVTLPNGGYKPANDTGYFLNLWIVMQKPPPHDNVDGRFIFRGARMRIAHN